jgi:hypothetical protein
MAFRVAERLLDSLVGASRVGESSAPEETHRAASQGVRRDLALLRESYRAEAVGAPCVLRKLEGVIDALSALSSELTSRAARA